MSEQQPLSRERIERGIERAISEQHKLTDQYRIDLDAAVRAEAEFKKRYAQERLIARTSSSFGDVKMNADIAEDIATGKTNDERLAMLTTSANMESTKQALLSVRSRINALQTLSANHREIT
jgi:hypothetical protein